MIREVCLGRAWQCPFNIFLSFPPSLTSIKIPEKKRNLLQLCINLVLERLVGTNPLLIFILCTGWKYIALPILVDVLYTTHSQLKIQSASFSIVCFSILWWLFLHIVKNSLSGNVHQAFSLARSLPGSSKSGQEKLNATKLIDICLSFDELFLHDVSIKSILAHLASCKPPSCLQLPVFVVSLGYRVESDPGGIHDFILDVLQSVESNWMSVILNVVFQITYKLGNECSHLWVLIHRKTCRILMPFD